MSSRLDRFYKRPEALRSLDEGEFSKVSDAAKAELGFLLAKGVPVGSGKRAITFKVLEGEGKGGLVAVPELPSDALRLFRVITEEHVTRTLSALAESILSDMLVNRSSYEKLWSSFGEFAVFENQCRLQRNRAFKTVEPGPVTTGGVAKAEVEKYRSAIASRIAVGTLRPLSPGQIATEGIRLFGVRYECNETAAINGLAGRFGSKLVYATRRQMPGKDPYQFTLGYSNIEGIQLEGKSVPIAMVFRAVAISPTLAPDARGVTLA